MRLNGREEPDRRKVPDPSTVPPSPIFRLRSTFVATQNISSPNRLYPSQMLSVPPVPLWEMQVNKHDEIARVARELYERSVKIEGRDENNWHEAERIVM